MDLSIIIPFYNSGEYLEEAISSIQRYSGYYIYEIIIINDGSTDASSIEILEKVEKFQHCTIIHQENKGANYARVNGCNLATGKYLLFLDSDNRITEKYITNSLDLLEADSKIGVVYGNAIFFGDNSRAPFKPLPFDQYRLMKGNYIDMCAFVRREAYDQAGGFDLNPNMRCLQDWELWLSIFSCGWNFHFLQDSYFEYRIHSNSITAQSLKNNKYEITRSYILSKHANLFLNQFAMLYNAYNSNKMEVSHYKHYFGKWMKFVKAYYYFKKKNT